MENVNSFQVIFVVCGVLFLLGLGIFIFKVFNPAAWVKAVLIVCFAFVITLFSSPFLLLVSPLLFGVVMGSLLLVGIFVIIRVIRNRRIKKNAQIAQKTQPLKKKKG